MKNPFTEMTCRRSVGFFGVGKTSLALMGLCADDADIVLRSDNEIDSSRLPPDIAARIYTSVGATAEIGEDILVCSPSVRRERIFAQRETLVTSDFEIFLRYNEKPTIIVTGSDGKTTTTALTSKILGEHFPAIGNIGEPMTPHLTDGARGYVIEASSFMLHYADPQSRRAAITSFSENHLNWHRDLAEYREAKMRAVKNTYEAVFSLDSPELFEGELPKSAFALTAITNSGKELMKKIRAELYYDVDNGYVRENGRRLIAISELKRQEEYNVKNYLNALALTRGFCSETRAIEVIRGFGGLPHRGERFAEISGVTYIDSSIDTTPARTIATLSGMPRGIILLLGGRDKGADFSQLARLTRAREDRVISFGEMAKRIKEILPESVIRATEGLSEATELAKSFAQPGDTVLLSPAATSYDEFSSFEERGDSFKKWILQGFCKS